MLTIAVEMFFVAFGVLILFGLKPVLYVFQLAKVSHGGPGTFEGPRRYLEWQKPVDLFIQYQQFCESNGEPSAAFSTFRRMMKKLFKTHLRFRDKGSFGQCDVCHKLRQRISKATTKALKTLATEQYSKHLLAQWSDRVFYWNLRSISKLYFVQSLHFSRTLTSDLTTSIVCLIQDGMDQAKLRVPRWGYDRHTKAAEKLYRPAIHLVGSWLHGYKLHLALSDEDQKKDSQTSIEMIIRVLSDFVANTGQMALGFHLQQDNCAREGKNRFVLNLMLILVVIGACRFTSMGFLRSSHSHEDIDQAFGQVARLIMGKSFGSATELISILETAIQSGQPSESSGRIRGSVANVFKLDQISVWKSFVRQTGISFKGLRHVHYYRFCLRRDMGSDVLDYVRELEELRPACDPHGDDIFMITKRWLADNEVQRAVCVMSQATAQQFRTGFAPPSGIAPRRRIGDAIVNNIKKRVPICQKTGELNAESAAYLLKWSQHTLAQAPKPEAYDILSHRWSAAMKGEIYHVGRWRAPRRMKHFDLALNGNDGDCASDESSGSEGDLALPIGFES